MIALEEGEGACAFTLYRSLHSRIPMSDVLGTQSPINSESISGIFNKHKSLTFGAASRYTFAKVLGDVRMGWYVIYIVTPFNCKSSLDILFTTKGAGIYDNCCRIPGITQQETSAGNYTSGLIISEGNNVNPFYSIISPANTSTSKWYAAMRNDIGTGGRFVIGSMVSYGSSNIGASCLNNTTGSLILEMWYM